MNIHLFYLLSLGSPTLVSVGVCVELDLSQDGEEAECRSVTASRLARPSSSFTLVVRPPPPITPLAPSLPRPPRRQINHTASNYRRRRKLEFPADVIVLI